MHAINCLMLPLQVLKHIVMFRQKQDKTRSTQKDPHAKRNMKFVTQFIREFAMKYVSNPILVGFILYGREFLGGDDKDYNVRVCIAFALINTSYLFLGSIGTLPLIGSFTNMISKVNYLKDYNEYCHMYTKYCISF